MSNGNDGKNGNFFVYPIIPIIPIIPIKLAVNPGPIYIWLESAGFKDKKK